MTTRSIVLSQATAALLLSGSISFLAADEPASETGDLWEVTSRMSMEGMPIELPAQTQRVCAPKEWTEPPTGPGGPGRCESTDFQKAGDKVTWKVSCSGPPPSTGVGEITRSSAEAYAGSIKFTSSDGVMTIKINGRRLDACTVGK